MRIPRVDKSITPQRISVLRPIADHADQSPGTPDQSERILHIRANGLCASCIHRDECTYPVPLGGVWNCEEYE